MSTQHRSTPWHSPKIAVNVIASQPVVQTLTIEMTGAATPILVLAVQAAMQVAVARTPDRVPVHRIVDVTIPPLNQLALMFGVVIRNHRKADATTPVRLVVIQIVDQTTPVLNHVALMIGVVTSNRRNADVVSSVCHSVVRAVALVHRSMAPVTIAADSFRLIVAVASLHHIAAVPTVGAAT